MMMRNRFPRAAYNLITLLGVAIALFGLAGMLILWALSSFASGHNPYIGIFIFVLFPGIMVFGLLLIPVGIYRERRRMSRGDLRPVVVDLSIPHHRNMLITFVAGTSVFLLVSTLGMYEGYHYTESVEFCGEVCHKVMAPEHTAYHNSAHAKVDCVKCHIGPGAGWYVKSKLSGARQVFKAALNIYPRPIETPITNLRPAQEVCEQCHWPQKFFPAAQITKDFYLGNEDNTHWQIKMLFKVGSAEGGVHSGIHWHVAPENKMHYVSSDSSRQSFDRVSWIDNGKEVVYTRGGEPMGEEALATARKKGFERVFDCIDCHNRPAHKYKSPLEAVNEALTFGRLSTSIPWIKREAVRALSVEYATHDGAMDSIAMHLENFYKERNMDLDPQAVATVQELFSENMFPSMRVRWDVYPENLSHFFFKGCFRCHGSDLKTAGGEPIPFDCNLCHTIVDQGPVAAVSDTLIYSGLEFKHPIDIDGAEKVMRCYNCHIGDDSIYLHNEDEIEEHETD